MNYKTTTEAAKILDLAKRTICKWALKLGFPLMGRDYLLTDEQMKLIDAKVKRNMGRPRKNG